MGNSVSCVPSKVPYSAVKIIRLYSSVQEFKKPMKAAELMLDNPQHFVCHSTALENGRRISALSADEELESGHLYFLLPMHKLHSSLSPSEMDSLALQADLALRKSTSKSMRLAKILPVLGTQFRADRKVRAFNGGDESNGGTKTAEAQDLGVSKSEVDDGDDLVQLKRLNLRNCKYWKPVLETIVESPRIVQRTIGAPSQPVRSSLLYVHYINRPYPTTDRKGRSMCSR